MEEKLKQHGYEIQICIPKDGNSFFEAVAHQLNQDQDQDMDIKKDQQQLREQLVQHLKQEKTNEVQVLYT